MPRHVTEALAASIWGVFGLLDTGHILGDSGFPEHVEASEDALIGEVEMTVAVATVLLDNLVLGAFLGDMPLLVTVVAQAVAASAS